MIDAGIDIFKTIPVTQQTTDDAGYVITGGLAIARDPETGAFNGSYHRMRVLGRDRTCITIQAGRHLLEIARKYRKAGHNQIPITVNVGAGPAVLLASSGSTQQTLTPFGYDELGFAGALQQEPVEHRREPHAARRLVACRGGTGARGLHRHHAIWCRKKTPARTASRA